MPDDRLAIVVRPSGPLTGSVPIAGAKNSVLKLMAAALMAPGTHELTNVPDITDVGAMVALVESMGCLVQRRDDRLTLDVPEHIEPVAPYELVEQFRASIVVLGPLLGRCGRAQVAMPGGDDFGPRPIDM
ncbi:MAG: UDP-N-acetylglucosamine 1-carboxyvinyltransferase, partial [Acidimicrobiia bacterium]|nr:UDP-N-acetylglucosamine 1-carboxyvinyltransferase [Acidimicrobiia bacterium]